MLEGSAPELDAGRWCTGANALSLLRLATAPALAAAVLTSRPIAAAALVAIAIATDLLDGPIARHRGESSPLGGLLDHGADAGFVTAGLAALAVRGEAPWLLPPLVALAFTQYVIDSRAARGAPLRGSRLGRWNGIGYFVPVAVAVGRDALGLGWPPGSWVRALGWLLVGTTLLSIADRLHRTRLSRRSRGSRGAGTAGRLRH